MGITTSKSFNYIYFLNYFVVVKLRSELLYKSS